HYLVPKDFKVDGIISSNGTNGVVHNETIFKHSLTFDTVNEIVKRAKAQAIYYEVFPFDGNRIMLNEDQTWAEAMFKQSTPPEKDRKSTRLNSSHVSISYAVFCLKKNITSIVTLSIMYASYMYFF